MTRKDYNLIADAIERSARHASRDDRNAIAGTATFIAHALRTDNPRFDTSRFMDACGFSATD